MDTFNMNDKANKRNSDGEMILSRGSYHAGPTAPLFLQKTYDMIESSPDHIACWSESGTSFIIKQPRDFAKSMLPLYFKHNNFRSFVRQLHFYGFRKHRHDEIMINTMNDETRNWWEFFNEKFVRGKGELMVQIRRKTYTDATASEKVEVEALKHSIECLQSQVSGFVNQLSELTSIVKNLVQEKLACEPLPSKRVKPSMTAPFLPPLAPFPTTCLPQAAVHLADTMAINIRPSDTSLLDWYGMDYMVGECNNIDL